MAVVDKLKKELTAPEAVAVLEDVPVRILTEDQSRVFGELCEFLRSKKSKHLLEGFAGTGKTFITREILDFIKISNDFKFNVAVTATTNKAVKVIFDQIKNVPGIHCICTIHSLLGLKEKVSNQGVITFEPDRSKPRKIDEVNLVLIDESSMLPDALFEEMVLYTKRGGKVLYIGDGCQIPPVGQLCSIPFNKKDREVYNIGHSMLTEIVRQKAGNPIIELSKEIRERPNYSGVIKDLMPNAGLENGSGIAYLDRKDIDTLNAILEKLYTSPKFKEDADFVKTIAWRNKIVDALNMKIRAYYLPDAQEDFVIGDKLVANTPIIETVDNRDFVIYTTNDEFEVTGVDYGQIEAEGGEFKVFVLTTVQKLAGTIVTKIIQVIHPDSGESLGKILGILKSTAVKLTDNPGARADLWKRYYALLKKFADVKYNYCITAHKSQGSTYENCIMMEDDININPNTQERNKIKYTAVTRASKRLIVVA